MTPIQLILHVIGVIFCGVGANVFFRVIPIDLILRTHPTQVMQFSMINYLFFLIQSISFLSIFVFFTAVLIKFWLNQITPKMGNFCQKPFHDVLVKFRKWKFGLKGFLTGISDFCFIYGGAYLPGFLQILLLQCMTSILNFVVNSTKSKEVLRT